MNAPREEGWHQDPDSGRFRYWTGTGWEDDAAAASAPTAPAAQAGYATPTAPAPWGAPGGGPAAPAPAPGYASSPTPVATATLPPPTPPLRDVKGWVVGLIVGGAVIVWGGLTAAVVVPLIIAGSTFSGDLGLGSGDFTEGTGEPPVQEDAEPLTDAVPGAWVTVTSPSGRMTFAVDPAWEALEGDDASMFVGAEGPDIWETAGWWFTDDDAGYLAITATHEYSTTWGPQEDAEWYIDPAGAYESEVTTRRALTTDAGYAAYEIAAQVDDEGYAYEECVIVIDTGASSVYLYASSDDPSLACTDLVRPVAQSLVVD